MMFVAVLPTVTAFTTRLGLPSPATRLASRSHRPVMLDGSLEIEALQRQIKILELQAQLQALQQAQTPAPEAAPAPIPTMPVPSPAPLEAVAPAQASAPLEAIAPVTAAPLEAVAPAPAIAPVPKMDLLMDPAAQLESGPPRCLGDECIKTVLNTPAGESNEIAQQLASGLGIVAIGLPLAYLAGTAFVDFINRRFEEIDGEVGGGARAPASSDVQSPYPWRK
jgi:hypothetical protein